MWTVDINTSRHGEKSKPLRIRAQSNTDFLDGKVKQKGKEKTQTPVGGAVKKDVQLKTTSPMKILLSSMIQHGWGGAGNQILGGAR